MLTFGLTLDELCHLSYPGWSSLDHHQNLGVVLNLALPLVDRGHAGYDVDTGGQLVGDQSAGDLLRLVGVGGRHEGHRVFLLWSGHATQLTGKSEGQKSEGLTKQIWHKYNEKQSDLTIKYFKFYSNNQQTFFHEYLDWESHPKQNILYTLAVVIIVWKLVICSEKKTFIFTKVFFHIFNLNAQNIKQWRLLHSAHLYITIIFWLLKITFLDLLLEKKVSNQSLHIIVFSFHFVKGN